LHNDVFSGILLLHSFYTITNRRNGVMCFLIYMK